VADLAAAAHPGVRAVRERWGRPGPPRPLVAGAERLYVAPAPRPERCGASAGPITPSGAAPSSHGPGLLDAIELARVLGRLAPTVWVYAIKGACWDVGRAVSPAVAVAVEQVADELIGLA
jgi:hypothetical protein